MKPKKKIKDNPFKDKSLNEVLNHLELGLKDVREGRTQDAKKAFKQFKEKNRER